MEKLWKKSKQQDTHLHYLPTFEALPEQVEQALRQFTKAPEEILGVSQLLHEALLGIRSGLFLAES
jgi:hypothetical protein